MEVHQKQQETFFVKIDLPGQVKQQIESYKVTTKPLVELSKIFDEIDTQKEEGNNKNIKIQAQMKKIGFGLNNKNMNKNLFAKNLSNIIGNFFNPLINTIVSKEKKVCEKLGLIAQNEDSQKYRANSNRIQEESKIQSNFNSKISKKIQGKRNLLDQNEKKQFIQNLKVQQQKQKQLQQGGKKHLKRRIIRKVVRKPQTPAPIKRTNQQKILVKQMEQNFDCKLKNNRLYMKGMPKKPVSSFFFFFKDYSKQLHDENQQLQVSRQLTYGSALAKRISQKWKQMTDEQRKPYKDLSVKTREAYRLSMQAFKSQNKAVFDNFKKIKRIKANQTRRIKIHKDTFGQNQDEQQIQVQQNSESDNQNENSHNKRSQPLGNSSEPINLEQEDDNEELPIVIPENQEYKKPKKGRFSKNRMLRQRFKSIHKPKSPSPSFFFFYNQKKSQISKQHNVTRGAKITQIASTMWKVMTDQDKRPYEILADERRKKYYEQMKKFQTDYPEEWSKMQAYKRKVATTNLNSKRNKPVVSQPEAEEQINDELSQQNSQSDQNVDKQVEIDSLEGNIIEKPKINKVQNKITTTIKNPIQIIQDKNEIEIIDVKKQSPKVNTNNQKKSEPQKRKRSRQSSCSKKESQSSSVNKDRQQTGDYKQHRPKAPASSFFMFYKMNNSVLADQFKESNGGKLVQYASQIWKNMTESQKRPYQIQAQESRERYYTQMKAYKQKYPEEIKKRKLDLKIKHQKQAQLGGNPKKKKKKSIQSTLPQLNKDQNESKNYCVVKSQEDD